jgi:DNA-directed RNA polymerase subunit D
LWSVLEKVKIEVLEKDDINLRVIIRDADVTLMNALRRIALAEVPCMAIEEVVMIENSAILQDEIISHRLGLTPLKTDLDTYNLPEDCPCQSEFGCAQCRVTLTLDAESKEGTRTVYSGELISENPDVMPVSDKIPIIKLAKGQKLKLEAYARLGKGKNCKDCQKCVDICPKKVFTIKENKVEVKDLLQCNLCMDCVEVCPKEAKGIKVDWEKNAFIMNIESTGVLPPERILMEATKILDKQLREFEEKLPVEST